MLLPRSLMEETGAVPSDTEGFVDIARSVKQCEGVALLVERGDGRVKVSLRSRGRLNVNRVASAFGGGGHVLASGAILPGPLEDAARQLLDVMRRELEAADSPSNASGETS